MKAKLWTRNFTLVTVATALGAAGGIAGGFALSFLVFDETGSTLASALILCIQLIPGFIMPLIAAPVMDRLPRKPFLVGGDLVNGLLYALAGLYLMRSEFSYIVYLVFSLLISTLGSFDRLAYQSIYPRLIPEGAEERGYTVSSLLYPVLQVVMTPAAALLYDTVGVAWILLIQATLSVLAGLTESRIQISEENRLQGQRYTLKMWRQDITEAAQYLKRERGLTNLFAYMATTNGMAQGYSPILVAFFRTTPGFTTAMYSLFSAAEFIGRTLGGLLHYHIQIPRKKRFGLAFGVYMSYETLDMSLLWLPYPLMLINRALAGFLGINSATMRQAAVQRYIPEALRARVNAFEDMLYLSVASVLSLAVGALGEVLDYRLCMALCGGVTMAVCWLTVWRRRRDLRRMYEAVE